MGYWPFEGTLADASGRGHDAAGPAVRFAEGKVGQALESGGRAVEVASHPDLQLAPGIALDCWVYFPKRPEGYEHIVLKEKEYQLRVDAPGEGGRFAFFVYLNDAWEPRVCGPVPEAGTWYHLTARWTGTHTVLEVNGEVFRTERRGVAAGTGNPVRVGACAARIDELRVSNAMLAQTRELRALADAAGSPRSAAAHFGGGDGWEGWRGAGGADVQIEGGRLRAVLGSPTAAAASPGMDLDLTGLRYLCADLEAPGTRFVNVVFITDQGEGSAAVPVWGPDRSSVVYLAASPLWRGRLRLLAFSAAEPSPGAALTLGNVWLSRRPEGRPYLYIRSAAPECALPRSGREEKVAATVRSLGKEARNVQVALRAPDGVRVVGEATRSIPIMPHDGTEMVVWTVQAERPMEAEFQIALSADGFGPAMSPLAVRFTAPPALPRADYVPEPIPAQPDVLTLMHYCPLWKEGTHYGWGKIEPWPERRPAIGFYDEGTAVVADWHIKMALEHGIQGFIYCWYRADFSPEIHESLGHAIHDGLLKARFVDRFRFAIMWENGCACGCKGRADLLENLMPYWIEKFFRHPSYVKLDNKPLLYIWVPNWVTRDLGGSDGVKEAFREMREMCRRAGFDGLWIVGCVGTADRVQLERMAREGWDASSAYGLIGAADPPETCDPEGVTVRDYASSVLNQERIWRGKKEIGALPDIIDVMQGWDPRPWHGARTTDYYAPQSVAIFEQACRRARALLEETPGNGLDRRVIVFDNWCEFGEGHYIEPTAGTGFGYVDAIRRVFAPKAPPCQDITPRDVGLSCPETAYLTRKEVLGGPPDRDRQVAGNLIAWWRFEDDDEMLCRDSSSCGFHGIKSGFRSAPGRVGKGFLCAGGSVALGPHRLLWPEDGITVEMWVKPAEPEQSDRWLLNTVGDSRTGYRLGLCGGRLCWQVPQSSWSHLLSAPGPLPVGEWSHVAATFDNEVMRLYVGGREVASLARHGPICPSETGLCLGSYSPGHARAFFQGVMDEVKVWNRALTPDEIRRHSETER